MNWIELTDVLLHNYEKIYCSVNGQYVYATDSFSNKYYESNNYGNNWNIIEYNIIKNKEYCEFEMFLFSFTKKYVYLVICNGFLYKSLLKDSNKLIE